MSFRAHILGAAAGGGLPQWNCGCDNCNLARSGDIPSQTQSSLAVTGDGSAWAVLNASPDIRQQLADTPVLHPSGLRDLPLRAVLVTNGDIDHIAGLLTLREMQPFTLFATAGIHEVLAQNPIFDALEQRRGRARNHCFDYDPLPLAPGVTVPRCSRVPGKVPLILRVKRCKRI
ncbi:MBL fold metallo-hydrolase [Roseobacter sp.]|uniref:MBL fold metallo-hydrolase n=1 Tax=Roseobacter sp. TaxID=1907202 RepID=UPI0029668AC5|nr:MBL fold metallo-hydrolase [Roseobacter sp.]MDW3183300.1 MBL fold metallo-hydrolase [Roseobacter sp.]